jgi:hypothetical protein
MGQLLISSSLITKKNINPHPILILIECLALVVRDVFWSLWGPMNSLDGIPGRSVLFFELRLELLPGGSPAACDIRV